MDSEHSELLRCYEPDISNTRRMIEEGLIEIRNGKSDDIMDALIDYCHKHHYIEALELYVMNDEYFKSVKRIIIQYMIHIMSLSDFKLEFLTVLLLSDLLI